MLLKHEDRPRHKSVQVPLDKILQISRVSYYLRKIFCRTYCKWVSKNIFHCSELGGVGQGEIFTSACLERDAEDGLA